MTNRNVIEIINRLMNPECEKIAATASEVFVAIVHGYYYIRPGKDTSVFLHEINSVLKSNWKDRPKMYIEPKDGLPYEAYIWGKMAGEALFIARSMFDKGYYESQFSRVNRDEQYNEALLEKYLYRLDEDELKSIFEGILTFKRNLDVFISDENFGKMMDELKECSLSVVENSPWYMEHYDEHIENIENNWDFCFSYLCRETIIETICSYIDEDPLMLATMIKAFRFTDEHTAAEYTSLAFWLAYGYELDIFNPDMTTFNDSEEWKPDHAWQVRTHNVGDVTVGVKAQ